MSNQKSCKKASSKRLSDSEIQAKNASRKPGKAPLTAEQKEAKRLANFLTDYGQILTEAGISTSDKTKSQLQAELDQYQASLAEQAKTDAKAKVKGFNPEALAEAEAAVEANPPQCAADLQHEKNLQGFAALQALYQQEQVVLWDEDLVNHGDVVAPTEEAVEPSQEEATVVEEIDHQPEEVVTMTTTYTKPEVLAIVPGPVSSVQEAIEMAVKAAYQPDMTKVEAARDAVYSRTLRLVDNAVDRFIKAAEANIKKDEEAILIQTAEQEGFEDAIAQAMKDYGQYGINQQMLIELVAEEEAAEKEAAAKAKIVAEQESLLKNVKKSYKKTVALVQELLDSGVQKMINHGNILAGVVKSFEGKRKALKLSQNDVAQLNAQTQKGVDMLEHARRVEEGKAAAAKNKAAKEAMKEAAVKWLLSKEAADFLSEEYVTHMSVGEYSDELGLAYRQYLAGQNLANKGIKTKQMIEQEEKAVQQKAAVTQRGAKPVTANPSVEEQAAD